METDETQNRSLYTQKRSSFTSIKNKQYAGAYMDVRGPENFFPSAFSASNISCFSIVIEFQYAKIWCLSNLP